MLVLDQVRIDRNLKGLAQEAYAHQCRAWAQEQLDNARVIEDQSLSPISPEFQAGRLYPTPERLEQELAKIPGSHFVFEPILGGQKKRLCWLLPDGTLDYLGVYEAGVTPEWSIMTASWKWEPDPDYTLGAKTMQRSDLTGTGVSAETVDGLIKKHGFTGAKMELIRQRSETVDPDHRPGFIKVLELGREAIRGWRTVITRPLQRGYITLNQAKAVVRALGGQEDRAQWARATGQSVAATI